MYSIATREKSRTVGVTVKKVEVAVEVADVVVVVEMDAVGVVEMEAVVEEE